MTQHALKRIIKDNILVLQVFPWTFWSISRNYHGSFHRRRIAMVKVSSLDSGSRSREHIRSDLSHNFWKVAGRGAGLEPATPWCHTIYHFFKSLFKKINFQCQGRLSATQNTFSCSRTLHKHVSQQKPERPITATTLSPCHRPVSTSSKIQNQYILSEKKRSRSRPRREWKAGYCSLNIRMFLEDAPPKSFSVNFSHLARVHELRKRVVGKKEITGGWRVRTCDHWKKKGKTLMIA